MYIALPCRDRDIYYFHRFGTARTKPEEENKMTTTFIIKETQNINSDREGTPFTGTLPQAKRFASRNQAFQNTILKIETASGILVSLKSGNKWSDA